MKIRALLIGIFLIICNVGSYCAEENIDELINQINNELIANPDAPVLPDEEALIAAGIFTLNTDDDPNTLNDQIQKIVSIYMTYVKNIDSYEKEFVYIHINMLKYMSDVCNVYKDRKTSDPARMLGGLSQMLGGSLTVISVDGELKDEYRVRIGDATLAITTEWWDTLTTPMQTDIAYKAQQYALTIKNPEVNAIMGKIGALLF